MNPVTLIRTPQTDLRPSIEPVSITRVALPRDCPVHSLRLRFTKRTGPRNRCRI